MNLNILHWESLKTRVTLFTLAIFLISIWSLAIFVSRTLRDDMQRVLGDQQISTVSFVAAGINQELEERIHALEIVASSIDLPMLNNPAALQRMLELRPVFQDYFSAGVLVLSLDGTAVAAVPADAGRRGLNYADNEADHIALTEGRAAISGPMLGRKLKQPQFNIAAPIRDAQGKVIGALVGVINLALPNFMDSIGAHRYGKSGGYLVVDHKHNLFVAATDKTRVMQPVPAPGTNLLFDKRMQGFYGAEVALSSLGVENLSVAERIPVADWFVVAALPTEEAFSPIRDMVRRIVVSTIFLTLLAGGLTWWMLRRQLTPLSATVKTLTALAASAQLPQPLPVARQDEIGELIGGFNRLLKTLAQREAALKESDERFNTLLSSVSEGVWSASADGSDLLYANHAFERLFGMSFAEIRENRDLWKQLTHPEDRALADASARDLLVHGSSELEYRIARRNGEVRWVFDRKTLVRDGSGKVVRIGGIISDITERKQMEEQVRQLAFYDALTKLPNRRLLDDRLRQSMAAGKRSGCYGALMFVDLDSFKLLNDTHGHEIGDLLLIEAADRLKSCVREMDTVARFGGDEFVVVISELDADKSESTAQAGIIAEKIRAALARPYALTLQHAGKATTTVVHRCTASIGVGLFGKQGASQDDILRWADMAMYQAKQAGCNLVRFYDSNA